jgi:hypothetical protein
MANTVWNGSDKDAALTLSGGNLTVTLGSSTTSGIRAVDKQIAGKFYWECTTTTWAGTSDSVGLAPITWARGTTMTGSVPGLTGLTRGGQIYVDGAAIVSGFGTIANGSVICIAFDADARLVWYRVGSAGNWNNSASANPATGAGGVQTYLGRGIPAYPALGLTISGSAVTANFGDTAFVGAVPSGFTSGFTAGASVPTNAIASQALAEHWLTTDPQAQVTQVMAEHWMSVSTTGLQAVVTQVMLEHWMSVAVVVPAAGGPQVTMIG